MAKKTNSKALLQKLKSLTEAERRSLYKQAARKRKAAMSKKRSTRDNFTKKYHGGELDETRSIEKRSKRGPVSLDDWALKILEQGDFDYKAAATDSNLETQDGMVISVRASSCRVICNGVKIRCLLRPELTIGQRSDLAVGDMVRFSLAGDGTHIIEDVSPRKSALSRPDPFDHRLERVIAANVDIAVIVGSVVSPELNVNLIDRYLLAIERGKVEPLICVNKIDLLKEDEHDGLQEQLLPYRKLGVRIVYCSASAGIGIDELFGHLAGKLAVFVGHSGVGKSSLLNTYKPDLALPTRVVRKGNLKGQHTTIKSDLYHLENGSRIIDTPGVRSFGLWKMAPEDLRWYFNEFDDYADSCKFSNCTHTHEPDCAVKQAVEDGGVLGVRYESYCRLLESL